MLFSLVCVKRRISKLEGATQKREFWGEFGGKKRFGGNLGAVKSTYMSDSVF
jgi:hypothetical protein